MNNEHGTVTLGNYKSINFENYKKKSNPMDAFLQAIMKCCEIEVNKQWIDTRYQQELKSIQLQVESQGATLEKICKQNNMTVDALLKNIRKGIESMVRSEMVMDAIAEDLQIEVTEKDRNANLAATAKANKMTVPELLKVVKDPKVYDSDILRSKAINALINKSYLKN